jgi:hypothetical protein
MQLNLDAQQFVFGVCISIFIEIKLIHSEIIILVKRNITF